MSAGSGGRVFEALSEEIAGTVARVAPAVVAIHGRRRIPSSGVHWQEGAIVTASHTVERDGELEVTLEGGTRATARVAGRDPATDLAVLRLEGTATAAPPVPPRAPAEGLAV